MNKNKVLFALFPWVTLNTFICCCYFFFGIQLNAADNMPFAVLFDFINYVSV